MAFVYAGTKRQVTRPLADDRAELGLREVDRSGPNPSAAVLSVQVEELRTRARAAVLREADPFRAKLLVRAVERLAKVVCAAAVLLVAGCENSSPHHAPPTTAMRLIERDGMWSVWHDDRRGVTCWMFAREAACLPDHELALEVVR